jgi:hypothetical protein
VGERLALVLRALCADEDEEDDCELPHAASARAVSTAAMEVRHIG